MLRPVLARALPFSLAVGVWSGSAAQTREIKNPVEGQPKAIERGDFVYKRRCASCHGFDGHGYRAPAPDNAQAAALARYEQSIH